MFWRKTSFYLSKVEPDLRHLIDICAAGDETDEWKYFIYQSWTKWSVLMKPAALTKLVLILKDEISAWQVLRRTAPNKILFK